MLGMGDRGAAARRQRGGAEQRNRVVQGVEALDEVAVMSRRMDGFVQRAVVPVERQRFARERRLLLQKPIQQCDVARAGMARGHGGSRALHRRTHLVKLLDRILVEHRYDQSHPGPQIEQAFELEARQCLAGRRAADPEQLRELDLAHPAAGRKAPLDDFLAQRRIGVVRRGSELVSVEQHGLAVHADLPWFRQPDPACLQGSVIARERDEKSPTPLSTACKCRFPAADPASGRSWRIRAGPCFIKRIDKQITLLYVIVYTRIPRGDAPCPRLD